MRMTIAKLYKTCAFSNYLYQKITSFIYLFIYLWLRWVFIAARGLSLVAVSGLLIVVASLVAEHRL